MVYSGSVSLPGLVVLVSTLILLISTFPSWIHYLILSSHSSPPIPLWAMACSSPLSGFGPWQQPHFLSWPMAGFPSLACTSHISHFVTLAPYLLPSIPIGAHLSPLVYLLTSVGVLHVSASCWPHFSSLGCVLHPEAVSFHLSTALRSLSLLR